jgi:hypothetical protein
MVHGLGGTSPPACGRFARSHRHLRWGDAWERAERRGVGAIGLPTDRALRHIHALSPPSSPTSWEKREDGTTGVAHPPQDGSQAAVQTLNEARHIAAYDCQDVRHPHARCSCPFLSPGKMTCDPGAPGPEYTRYGDVLSREHAKGSVQTSKSAERRRTFCSHRTTPQSRERQRTGETGRPRQTCEPPAPAPHGVRLATHGSEAAGIWR